MSIGVGCSLRAALVHDGVSVCTRLPLGAGEVEVVCEGGVCSHSVDEGCSSVEVCVEQGVVVLNNEGVVEVLVAPYGGELSAECGEDVELDARDVRRLSWALAGKRLSFSVSCDTEASRGLELSLWYRLAIEFLDRPYLGVNVDLKLELPRRERRHIRSYLNIVDALASKVNHLLPKLVVPSAGANINVSIKASLALDRSEHITEELGGTIVDGVHNLVLDSLRTLTRLAEVHGVIASIYRPRQRLF